MFDLGRQVQEKGLVRSFWVHPGDGGREGQCRGSHGWTTSACRNEAKTKHTLSVSTLPPYPPSQRPGYPHANIYLLT